MVSAHTAQTMRQHKMISRRFALDKDSFVYTYQAPFKGIFHADHLPATVGMFGALLVFALMSLQFALTPFIQLEQQTIAYQQQTHAYLASIDVEASPQYQAVTDSYPAVLGAATSSGPYLSFWDAIQASVGDLFSWWPFGKKKTTEERQAEVFDVTPDCPNDCGATAKAELTVYESSKFYSPQPPKTTDSIYVRFTVKNDGNAVAAASSVKIYVDTNSNPTNATPVVTTLSAPQLAAGGSSQLSYTFAKNYFTAGIHTVSALLDAGNAVSETNEGNNFVKIAEFTVVADPSASCPELATQTVCNSRIDCFWDVNTCVPLTNIQGGTTCREQGGEPAKFATRQALAASLCAGSTNIDVVDLAKYSCQCGVGKCWNGTTCETPVSKCEKNGYCEAGETAANCADDCFNSNCNQITSQTECSDRPACNWNASLTKCFFKGDISGTTPGTPDGKVNNMDLIYMLQH